MKKSNSNNNVSSILNVLGITPQIIVISLLIILFVGIIIGLFVKKQNVVSKRMTVVEEVVPYDRKQIFEQSMKSDNEVKQIKDSPFEKNSLIVEKVDKPVIAVIIDDMGVDMIRTQKILELDYPLTVSYLTYAPNLQSQINHAKEANNEILLHVPMQALNDNYDYGGEYLSTNNSKNRNLEILKSQLDKATGYIGINNHMGSKFTSDESQLSMVVEELDRRGLSFVDSLTASQSKGDIVAKKTKIPYATRDVFLDDSNKLEDIKKSLKYLENIAKKRGFAVAIGHPRTNTIKVLKAWLPTLQKKGIELVPISYIIKNYPKF
ncbi:divergent polysaccharide deacetylase family protein [bacterium]|nr:divergent polysaccharide deacetylase family protein [bacterium]